MTELQILYSLILDKRNIEIYLFFLQSWKLNWAELIFWVKLGKNDPLKLASVLLVWLTGLLLFYKFVYRGLIMPGFSSIFWQKRFSFILIRFLSKNMSGTDLIKFKNSLFSNRFFWKFDMQYNVIFQFFLCYISENQFEFLCMYVPNLLKFLFIYTSNL